MSLLIAVILEILKTIFYFHNVVGTMEHQGPIKETLEGDETLSLNRKLRLPPQMPMITPTASLPHQDQSWSGRSRGLGEFSTGGG